MKELKRETMYLPDMVRATREHLREFNISETVIKSVIQAYVSEKKEALLQGKYIHEDGIATEGMLIRGVSKGFTDKGFTVKIKESIDYQFRTEAMSRMDNDKDLQYRMDFDASYYQHNESED